MKGRWFEFASGRALPNQTAALPAEAISCGEGAAKSSFC